MWLVPFVKAENAAPYITEAYKPNDTDRGLHRPFFQNHCSSNNHHGDLEYKPFQGLKRDLKQHLTNQTVRILEQGEMTHS
jgi:hypothetical protein